MNIYLIAQPGFEPRQGGPKSPVLPLHHRAKVAPVGLEPTTDELKVRYSAN
jgi:hypothetical protein